MTKCTWEKQDGRWICMAKKCHHWKEGGICGLGKVSLTCDNWDCEFNIELTPGVYGCHSMNAHLDANGKCLKNT